MKKKTILTMLIISGALIATPFKANSQSVNNKATVTLRGNNVELSGVLPEKGTYAPDFTGVNNKMQDVSLDNFKGRKVILNIFPSLDTPTCALSVRQFNQMASELENTSVLCVSMDLPFAQSRFCSTEGIENVTPLSVFRNPEFGEKYGLLQTTGPSHGLLARAVIVIDENGKIIYTQLVQEISQEPDYDDVMKNIK
ncbi:MAG: thiol peroxidase [Phocaeicola sp.]|nr:thiol peroxidase [Phocaeicola sp.]